jgi:hypothetical protein
LRHHALRGLGTSYSIMNEETPSKVVIVDAGDDPTRLVEIRALSQPTEVVVVGPPRRPHTHLGMRAISPISLSAAAVAGALSSAPSQALGAWARGAGLSLFPGPRKHPRGDCEVCGKKDVAAGHQRGIYRCREHLDVVEVPLVEKPAAPHERDGHSYFTDDQGARVCTGARMGRYTSVPADYAGEPLILDRVPLDDTGYDSGGAYWGVGEPLWCAWGDSVTECVEVYVRAVSRADAEDRITIKLGRRPSEYVNPNP